MDVRYHIRRYPNALRADVLGPGGTHLGPLNPRLDLFNHGPDFECGYHGSGPAQLALAILAHHIGDEARAVRLHQAFKRAFVANWNIPLGNHLNLDSPIIERWLATYRVCRHCSWEGPDTDCQHEEDGTGYVAYWCPQCGTDLRQQRKA